MHPNHGQNADASAANSAKTPGEGLDGRSELLSQAVAQHRAGNFAAARQGYERILADDPTDPNALHLLGVVANELGDPARAIQLILRSLDLVPENPSALNNLGNILRKQSLLAEAVDAYERCLAMAPNSAGTLSNLGIAWKGLGRYDEAVDCFRKAIAIEPKHSGAHHNLGNVLVRLGRYDEAIEAYRRAVSLFPGLAAGRHRLGAVLAGVGRLEDAARVYAQWLEVDPDNALARHLLASCSGVDVPARTSDQAVQEMFDLFSEKFDVVLERLGYRAPALVEQAIADILGDPRGDRVVLDAGCGTGLCGPSLRRYAQRLVGVDLSPGMVEKARARGVYDDLSVEELTRHLRTHRATYDLAACADTLCYFGDLGPVLDAASNALRPAGILVFTLESLPAEEVGARFRLLPHGRYAHSEAYVRAVSDDSRLEVVALATVQLRLEMQKPVQGWLLTARKK